MEESNQPTTVVECMRHLAQKKPNKPAFIFVDKSLTRMVLTRQQLWEYCRKFAAVLRGRNLGKGSVICDTLLNSPQRIITQLGAITAGAISVNGQTCRADGLDFINSLKVGAVNALILDSQNSNSILGFLKPKLDRYDELSGRVSCSDVPSLKYILDFSLEDKKRFFDDLDAGKEMVHEDITPDDVCQYLCTSGSTTFFKLVAFSSKGLLEYGRYHAEMLDLLESDVVMNNKAVGWLGGYPLPYLVTGMTRLMLDLSNGLPNKSWETQWKIAVQEKCTVVHTHPNGLTEFNRVRESSEDMMLRTYKLRVHCVGGCPMTKKQLEAALGNVSDTIRYSYGSTEAGFTSCNPVTSLDGFEEFNTGYPLSGVTVKVVDKDGKEVLPGQRGEILIQPSQRSLYYVKDPEKTSATYGDDGWIRLGDIGMLNSKGHLFVVGRDKFAILRGSVVFYPDPIEALIRECPGVKDVAVTGVPDENLFEQVCALVIKETTVNISTDSVLKYCEESINTFGEKLLAPVPKYILFVESFPMTQSGKLKRKEVRIKACELLGLKQ